VELARVKRVTNLLPYKTSWLLIKQSTIVLQSLSLRNCNFILCYCPAVGRVHWSEWVHMCF